MKNKTVAIIGGGASGLYAAITAAYNGHKVTIFEKNNKLGKKILATGNGRCNILNNNPSLDNFHTSNISFKNEVINLNSKNKILEFFKSIGLLTIEGEKSNRLYPMSLQSSSVVDLLELEIKRLKIQVKISSHITNIKYTNNTFNLTVNNTLEYNYDKIIIATGSLAQPKLGACDDGHKFAKNFNHNIISTSPTLVQLISDFNYLSNLSGVKINAKATLYINDKKYTESIGDILFTKYGLSGSSILEISREVDISLSKNKNIHIQLDLIPNISSNELEILLNNGIKLNGILNQKIVNFILQQEPINKKEQIKKLKCLKLNIIGTKGFEFSEVCAGGIDTKEINPKTMESLKHKNIYFCGEVLDIDGDCGGFNLHWAWLSGYIAGSNI
jgi:predicted Rossmann fold flavoprotein